MRGLPFVLCAGLMVQTASAATYFVSAQTGNDANAGTSAEAPWRSLGKVNASRFQPGDQIRLAAGSRWQGQLTLPSSGTAAAPILVDRYGEGPRPRIDAGDIAENALTLRNVEYVQVHNLELTNQGKTPAVRRGVLIAAENIGTLHGIVVSDLYIHDINGALDKKDNGGILFRTIGAEKPSRFAGLKIERNILWRVDRTGIVGFSDQFGVSKLEWVSPWYPSLYVVIRDNYVEDVGGDGITPWATYGALVEHNIVTHASQRSPENNAGIWPWSTDNTLLQLNAASFTKGSHDGEGFDSDYNSRHSKFLYNLSRENDGGFLLVCAPSLGEAANFIGNTGTVVRNNISWHDHHRGFALSGPTSNTLIENNALYFAAGETVQAILTTDWSGWAKKVTFRGNLFAAAGTAIYGHATTQKSDGNYESQPGWGGARGGNLVFENNRFVGQHQDAPEAVTPGDASGQEIAEMIAAEPRFNPGEPDGFKDYLQKHRAWMLALFTRQFGAPPALEAPAPVTAKNTSAE